MPRFLLGMEKLYGVLVLKNGGKDPEITDQSGGVITYRMSTGWCVTFIGEGDELYMQGISPGKVQTRVYKLHSHELGSFGSILSGIGSAVRKKRWGQR